MSAIAFPAPPKGRSINYGERLRLPAPQGTISAVLVQAPTKGTPERLIIYAHGNAEDLSELGSRLQRLAMDCQADVLAFDYYGYGMSDGIPSAVGLNVSIDAAYEEAKKRVTDPMNIVVYGRSLGGGPAIDLVSRHPEIGSLVLQSPLTSGVKWLLGLGCFGKAMSCLLTCADLFHNDRKIRNVHQPVLIMHGAQDRVVPIQHGQALFQLAKNAPTPLWVPWAGHNDMPEDDCNSRVKAFIRGGYRTQ